MRLQGLVVAAGLMLSLVAAADSQTAQRSIALHMADGQLRSHPVRLYVEHEVTPEMHPCLDVIGVKSGGFNVNGGDGIQSCESRGLFSAQAVASQQQWSHPIANGTAPKVGTLLIFDLSSFDVDWYKAGRRVLPRLIWWEPDGAGGALRAHSAIGEREIYLANGAGAIGWTLVIIALLLVTICWMAGGRQQRGLRCIPYLLSSADNYMSVSMTQMACWTVAIGGVVLGFSLATREIPDIPESLIFLMGFSTVTTAVGHWQSQRGYSARQIKGGADLLQQLRERRPRVRDLFIALDEHGNEEPSLAKAQMFFWTVLMIIMFVVKSSLDGHLWEIPEGFVALMGISQAGYLGNKQLELAKKGPAAPVAPPARGQNP